MADTNTRLTFEVAGNTAAGQKAIADLGKSFTSEFGQMSSVATAALGKVSSSLTDMAGRIPGVGNAVNSLTSEMTSLGAGTGEAGASIAAMAGPIGIAIAAAGAMVVGVVKLEEGLFSLAQSAADSQGKLFDLSQQTGVSVETLSALDLLAQTTGGNIEGLAASLGVFQKNLENADDAGSKASQAFKTLGIETTNTEDALRQTLASLAKMPEGFQQTALALEIFGRGGKQFLAILKESHGSIEQTIKDLQDMGLASGENAKRADEFNDQLILVKTQLLGLTTALGNEAIPAILDASKQVSKILKENKDAISDLAVAVKALTFLLVTPLKGAIESQIFAWRGLHPFLVAAADAYERIAAAAQLVSGSVPHVDSNAIPVQPLGEGGGSGIDLLRGAQKSFQSGLKPFNAREIFGVSSGGGGGGSASSDAGASIIRQLQSELRGLNDATKVQAISAELLDSKFKNLSASARQEALTLAALIDVKRHQIDVDRTVKEETEKFDRERLAALASLNNFLETQADKLSKARGEFKSTGDEANKWISTFENVGDVLRQDEIFWIRFTAAMTDSALQLKKIRGTFDDVVPNIDLAGRTAGVGGIGGSLSGELLPPPDPHTFDAWKDAFSELKDIGGGAMSELAHGIGSLVENYVLLGTTGPNAMKKLVASVIAGVAAQAAVKAVFELAEGFAALFLNPAEAAAHFTSAAIFGSIAGVAAVAGRQIAGNSFAPAGSAGGGRTGTGATAATTNPAININRNASPINVHVTVVGQATEGFRFMVADAVAADYKQGGTVARVIGHATGQPGNQV